MLPRRGGSLIILPCRRARRKEYTQLEQDILMDTPKTRITFRFFFLG